MITSFCSAFGLANADPVGGFVTGAGKAIFFHEGFQQVQGMVIYLQPVIRDSSRGKGQDFGGQAFYGNPREHEEPGVRGHEMEVSLLGGLVPADEGIAGFDSPGARAPSEACDGSIVYKGHVLEVIADDLPIPQVMMVLNQAVVEGFKIGSTNQGEANSWELRERSLNRALINLNSRNSSITSLIVGAGTSGGKADKAPSVQGEQQLPTGHILEAAIGLTPIPGLAKDF